MLSLGVAASTEPSAEQEAILPHSGALRRLVALARGLRNTAKAFVRLFGRRKEQREVMTILVTGASAGIGLELAKLLREGPHRLALTARASSLERFAEAGLVAGERLLLLPLDVTVDDQRRAVIRAVEARWGGVDVLVNNAGISYRAVAEHVTEGERLAQLDANFLGPMELIRLVLPHMRSQRYGRIINVSSVGGMTAMPTMSIYSASKFALEGASESLWYEMRPFGVHVSLVRPGFINSDGFRKVRFTAQGQHALADPSDPYHAHYANMDELIAGLMTLTFYTPRDVAETILDVIEHKNPPLWVAGTLDARLFDLLRRVIPSGLYHRLLYAALPRIWRWGQSGSLASSSLPPRRSGSSISTPTPSVEERAGLHPAGTQRQRE
ncbi:MAG TPA: SDR family oxidoreductase [Polyangiaceae bacterium]|nr:SDR family oxidoreductase [Polyangiaceae bacterium]